MSSKTFDPIWEELRQQGQNDNKYPYDFVVSFVFRHSRSAHPGNIEILEVGCGTGNNLWFAAREGFHVTGIDASPSAIALAQKRFAREGLNGAFHVGDMTRLPFADESFSLAIDRGAIVCCGLSHGQQAVSEIRRVLRPGGRFLFNPFSSRHTSGSASEPGPDGLRLNIHGGNLRGVGQVCLYNRQNVESVLSAGWRVLQLEHLETVDEADPAHPIHAEWRVVAEKRAI